MSHSPRRRGGALLAESRLVLTAWILGELHEVVGRKRPDLLETLDAFLASLAFDIAELGDASGDIADMDDKPILDAARPGDVDVIVTGDKHFLELTLERPQILTPREYLSSVCRAWGPGLRQGTRRGGLSEGDRDPGFDDIVEEPCRRAH